MTGWRYAYPQGKNMVLDNVLSKMLTYAMFIVHLGVSKNGNAPKIIGF